MPFKKPVFLFLVFFISCSTSIRDQIGQPPAVSRISVDQSTPDPVLLAQMEIEK